MFPNERAYAIRRLLLDHVSSPSLRHIRDERALDRLTEQIIKAIDREPSVWRKWETRREELVRAAADVWVPIEDLREFLNELPGPKLTSTDVAQRLRAIQEEPYRHIPDQAIEPGCLELYAREKAEGTELPAIIGRLEIYVYEEEERLRLEHRDAAAKRREQERVELEERFLSGADCKWTPINKSKELYIRKNGRAYRLAPRKDKRWDLFRIEGHTDQGSLVGTYGSRGDANKALANLAYVPEPRR